MASANRKGGSNFAGNFDQVMQNLAWDLMAILPPPATFRLTEPSHLARFEPEIVDFDALEFWASSTTHS